MYSIKYYTIYRLYYIITEYLHGCYVCVYTSLITTAAANFSAEEAGAFLASDASDVPESDTIFPPILEPQNLLIYESYTGQKYRSTDFEAIIPVKCSVGSGKREKPIWHSVNATHVLYCSTWYRRKKQGPHLASNLQMSLLILLKAPTHEVKRGSGSHKLWQNLTTEKKHPHLFALWHNYSL